ncbi:hypothetical protein NPX13_g1069 [Xylaria arbuscula]|uniref:Uncharacterized protein n=1 Tax=Xylaria arbuscula TaxID=114810 RepID=A0A9W8NMS5_9PEZI|nr:hypothetical protein NPX13_g1069 [Xylaria arbuscula]
MSEPVRTVMNRTNILETVDGDVRVRYRWPRKDNFKGPPDLPADFQTSEKVSESLDALQVLQFSRRQYLTPSALTVPLEYLLESQPWMVQADVNIFPANRCETWSRVVAKDYYRYELDDLVEEYKDAMTSKPYQFRPVDVSPMDSEDPPHWILIVLHLTRHLKEEDDLETPDNELEGPYNLVESFAVVDPHCRTTARDVEERVVEFLEQLLPKFGIEFYWPDVREYPWVPPSM